MKKLWSFIKEVYFTMVALLGHIFTWVVIIGAIFGGKISIQLFTSEWARSIIGWIVNSLK